MFSFLVISIPGFIKKLDPDNDHIDPHVWGKRQSIDDPLRDNAI